MKKISTEAVLFDLDGTFADTAPDLGAALNHVLNLHHRPSLPLEKIRPQASHGVRGLLKLGFDIEPDAPIFDALRIAFLDHYTAHLCDHTHLFDGIAELIIELERRRLPWGIVTNKPHRYTVPLMEALGYATRAACLISGDTCARAKPHPDPLLKACRDIGATPERCLYLGDDLRDMQAARAANMTGIIAGWGYIGTDIADWNADGVVTTPSSLLDYL